jgi:glutamate synthase (NADPH/NADH) large chain
MTGGRALILGKTGRNFAAGMSGGIAWVYDSDNSFVENCNTEMVDLDPLSPRDEVEILSLLKKHVQLTQSQVAKYILDDWAQQSSSFIKVFPKEYKKVLLERELQQSAG